MTNEFLNETEWEEQSTSKQTIQHNLQTMQTTVSVTASNRKYPTEQSQYPREKKILVITSDIIKY